MYCCASSGSCSTSILLTVMRPAVGNIRPQIIFSVVVSAATSCPGWPGGRSYSFVTLSSRDCLPRVLARQRVLMRLAPRLRSRNVRSAEMFRGDCNGLGDEAFDNCVLFDSSASDGQVLYIAVRMLRRDSHGTLVAA